MVLEMQITKPCQHAVRLKMFFKSSFQEIDDQIISVTQHNHAPDSGAIDEMKYRTALKRRAANDSSGPLKLIRLEPAKHPVQVQGRLNTNIQRKLVDRVHGNSRSSVKEPQTLEDVVIPERLKKKHHRRGQLPDS